MSGIEESTGVIPEGLDKYQYYQKLHTQTHAVEIFKVDGINPISFLFAPTPPRNQASQTGVELKAILLLSLLSSGITGMRQQFG